MALTPATGALSQTQLAVLEQIRALRAAKASVPAQPAQSIAAKPVAAQAAPTPPLATENRATPIPANLARGSILNITV